jgi:hypothetical protein
MYPKPRLLQASGVTIRETHDYLVHPSRNECTAMSDPILRQLAATPDGVFIAWETPD